MRIAVLDTNIIVSGFLSPGAAPGQVVGEWKSGAFDVAVSELLFEEIAEVLNRPIVRRTAHVTDVQVSEFLQLMRTTAIFVNEPLSIVPVISADSDDDVVVATALAAQADVIVSGDKHLLGLGEYEGIQIVTAREFLVLL
jgi:putative PIN family toxin of toxin-antitoxin system